MCTRSIPCITQERNIIHRNEVRGISKLSHVTIVRIHVVGITSLSRAEVRIGDRILKKYEWGEMRLTENEVGW